MFEIKITIEATQLSEAINNLAKALNPTPVIEQLTVAQPTANVQLETQQSTTPPTPAVQPVVATTPVAAPTPTTPTPAPVSPTPQQMTHPTPVPPTPQPTVQPVPVAPVPQPMTQPTPVTPVSTTAPATSVPLAPTPQYTVDQIQLAGGAFVGTDTNKMSLLKDLLNQFGVQAVTQLKPEQLGAFATAMRGLGAQI